MSDAIKRTETKSEAFHRVARARLGRLVGAVDSALTVFENLSGGAYEWTPDEVDAYMAKLLEKVEERTCEVSTHFHARHSRKGMRGKRLDHGAAFEVSVSVTPLKPLALPSPDSLQTNVIELVPQLEGFDAPEVGDPVTDVLEDQLNEEIEQQRTADAAAFDQPEDESFSLETETASEPEPKPEPTFGPKEISRTTEKEISRKLRRLKKAETSEAS